MQDEATMMLQWRAARARPHPDLSIASSEPAPDEKQDQLQTWEGEGGSTAHGARPRSDTSLDDAHHGPRMPGKPL